MRNFWKLHDANRAARRLESAYATIVAALLAVKVFGLTDAPWMYVLAPVTVPAALITLGAVVYGAKALLELSGEKENAR